MNYKGKSFHILLSEQLPPQTITTQKIPHLQHSEFASGMGIVPGMIYERNCQGITQAGVVQWAMFLHFQISREVNNALGI